MTPPDYMARKVAQVEALQRSVGELFGRPTTIQIRPENINNYYDIECPLHARYPASMAALEYEQVKRYGPGAYFQLVCSVVAPVVAGIWHRFYIRNSEWEHDMFDFLSEAWFVENREYEDIALELIQTIEGMDLSALGWDITLKPADEGWPPSPYMPEEPELRHYLFPGYYDDWGGIAKPIPDR